VTRLFSGSVNSTGLTVLAVCSHLLAAGVVCDP